MSGGELDARVAEVLALSACHCDGFEVGALQALRSAGLSGRSGDMHLLRCAASQPQHLQLQLDSLTHACPAIAAACHTDVLLFSCGSQVMIY